ncbi:hypothetical protein IGI04_014948 [Brassica rapa subsp. trilocularis]|uniref:DUF4005 domain-containing protein n=1 Tax=Brassica rapa subsp. trilocularis TaxID=1813537 RepID=A0ABQ7MRQ4_BRACM|nr:hypothetical protein IGI04_014948 [Brassica rapa subsp. trilocularis]
MASRAATQEAAMNGVLIGSNQPYGRRSHRDLRLCASHSSSRDHTHHVSSINDEDEEHWRSRVNGILYDQGPSDDHRYSSTLPP